MITDGHFHILKNQYNNIEKITDKFEKNNTRGINIGTDLETSEESCILSGKIKGMYSAIGLHPSDVSNKNYDISSFKSRLVDIYNKFPQQIVAIGETGLNLFEEGDFDSQIIFFKTQIEIAQELNLPLIIHSRNSYEEVLKILKEIKDLPEIVIHCWNGTPLEIKPFIELGCHFTVGGIPTFKNADIVREAILLIPLDKLMFETDSPWLAPSPKRGEKNYPWNVSVIIKFVANLLNLTFEEMNEINNNNFERLYKI